MWMQKGSKNNYEADLTVVTFTTPYTAETSVIFLLDELNITLVMPNIIHSMWSISGHMVRKMVMVKCERILCASLFNSTQHSFAFGPLYEYNRWNLNHEIKLPEHWFDKSLTKTIMEKPQGGDVYMSRA